MLTVIVALASLLATTAGGCSLGNIAHTSCTTSTQCAQLFGLGSACTAGYCTDAPACQTGHDCREQFGGGACVSGLCTATLPRDPACFIVEPPDVFKKSAVGEGSYTLLGGVFSIHDPFDVDLTKAARLAVQEINRTGGGNDGRPMGIVFCDNGGQPAVSDAERVTLNEHAMDYLSGTLGIPVVIGPGSSADALSLINRVLKKSYPTAIISPAASSAELTKQPDRLDPKDPYGLFWRTFPSDQFQGQILAEKVLIPDTTLTKVAVVYQQDPYGEGLSQVISKAYTTGTTSLVPYDGTDYSTVGQRVAMAAPEGVVVIAIDAQHTLDLLQVLSDAGFGALKYFFADSAKNKDVLLAPTVPVPIQNMIKGAKGTAPAPPAGANYDLFSTNLLQEFSVQASSNPYLAQTYDATYCAAYGVIYGQAKSMRYDGRLVVAGLANLSSGVTKVNVGPIDWSTAKANLTASPRTINIVGTSGDLDFDASTGEAPAPIEVWGVAADFSDFTTIP
jgi:branched-chain amino acid transport system substrate-binding protein